MALWFAGAAPTASRSEQGTGLGVRRVDHSEGCLELGSLAAQVPYRAHGRKKATAAANPFRLGDCDESVAPVKVGLKILAVARPMSQGKTYEKLFTSPPPPRQACPFAAEDDAAVLYKCQKKTGYDKTHDNAHDGDAFVLRKSRTPPAGARMRSNEEGFCVILPTSGQIRLGQSSGQMVRSEKNGKGTTQFDTIVQAKRECDAQKVASAHETRCLAAQRAEVARTERQALHESRLAGRSRWANPSETLTVSEPPFALGLPSRNDFVGQSMSGRKWQSARIPR